MERHRQPVPDPALSEPSASSCVSQPVLVTPLWHCWEAELLSWPWPWPSCAAAARPQLWQGCEPWPQRRSVPGAALWLIGSTGTRVPQPGQGGNGAAPALPARQQLHVLGLRVELHARAASPVPRAVPHSHRGSVPVSLLRVPCAADTGALGHHSVGVQSIVSAGSQGSQQGERGHLNLQHIPGAAGNRQHQQNTKSKVFCKQKAAHLAGAHLAGAHLAAGTAWQRGRRR